MMYGKDIFNLENAGRVLKGSYRIILQKCSYIFHVTSCCYFCSARMLYRLDFICSPLGSAYAAS